MNPIDVVHRFWTLMATNDFDSVAGVLHDRFILHWPQSGEKIKGAANFAGMNRDYPAHGRWQFEVRRIVADGDQVVTEVDVTDSVITGLAISFFTIEDARIVSITEYWPDPFPPPEARARWVEPS